MDLDYKFKKIDVGNYKVCIVDNLFTLDERFQFYNFFRNSLFRIGWEDTEIIEKTNMKYLHSIYNEEDIKNLKFFNRVERCKELISEIGNKKLSTAVVNLSFPVNSYNNHTHPGSTVLLYYGNLNWDQEWGGETLFYNESLEEVIFASPFKPGRLILFDGRMPHTIRAQSGTAPNYRFTLSCFLRE